MAELSSGKGWGGVGLGLVGGGGRVRLLFVLKKKLYKVILFLITFIFPFYVFNFHFTRNYKFTISIYGKLDTLTILISSSDELSAHGVAAQYKSGLSSLPPPKCIQVRFT